MKTIEAFVIDVNKGTVYVAEFKTVSDYCIRLNADMFDITRRRINGKIFDVFCDDEGLLKEDMKVSAFNSDGSVALVGNLIISKNDGFGNGVSLTDNDINLIIKSLRAVIDSESKEEWPAVIFD